MSAMPLSQMLIQIWVNQLNANIAKQMLRKNSAVQRITVQIQIRWGHLTLMMMGIKT